MIPYEELVTALARWRARHGLPTGLGDYLGESAPPPPAHGAQAVRDYGRDEIVELGDEHIEGMIESQLAHDGGAVAVDEHDLADAHDMPELVDFGAPGSEESTKPAGLAGLIDPGPVAGADLDAALEPAPDDDHGPSAEPKPPAKGRSRGGGRRRRK